MSETIETVKIAIEEIIASVDSDFDQFLDLDLSFLKGRSALLLVDRIKSNFTDILLNNLSDLWYILEDFSDLDT